MKLQDHIDSTDLDMTEIQVKAFFLGVLCAEKPMPFAKALEEILSETPDARGTLEVPFKEVWSQLQNNPRGELEKMFPEDSDVHAFIEVAKDQLDYFLTGMSLSGTNMENCDDEELAELIDELEDTVEDMDDFLADSETTTEDGEELRKLLLDTWREFTSTKPVI